jgi:hypothetical protein
VSLPLKLDNPYYHNVHIRENQLGMLDSIQQKGNQQLVGVLNQDFSRFEKK